MASNLPDYVASAQPVPLDKRIPWYKSTAQTYAGIMLWFVFWKSVPMGEGSAGGTLTMGLGYAFIGLIAAALFCHAFYYLVPGMLGLKTGLPLYIVGTSTYGVRGGFIMPGFLMGLLQFGWLGVNACAAASLLCAPFLHVDPDATIGTVPHAIVSAVWAAGAAFMGLKGIRYVARVATYFPIIPLAILLILGAMSVSGIRSFNPQKTKEAGIAAAQQAAKEAADKAAKEGTQKAPKDSMKEIAAPAITSLSTPWEVIALLLTSIIGFFATAGAAGVDFGMNNRNGQDVQLGGLVGIAGSTILAGGLALLIVAGAHGQGIGVGNMDPTALMPKLLGDNPGRICMYLLAIASFPPACFSSFIAANSFKTTLPKVNPFISVGVGTLIAIALAATGAANKVVDVFVVIGASFGPICGAMAADYLLAGRKWAGPRAGFNPAGWISWAVGFVVGAAGLLAKYTAMVPALAPVASPLKTLSTYVQVPPLSALIVGFVLYLVLAKIGLVSRTLEKPQAATV
jgi:cytosine permease